MFSAVAWKYASEQYAFESAATTGQLVVVLGGGPRRVVRGGLAGLDLEQHVGALVLDRLERTDRTAELHAVLGVLHRHVEHELRAAHHLVGERDRGLVERLAVRREAVVGAAERLRLDVVELELRLLARHVHRRERRAGETVGVAPTVKNEMPSVPVVPARRATTTMRSAVKPSSTNIFSPESVKRPPSPSVASIVMPVTSHFPFGSVNASVAIVSPLAMPGRSSCFWSSVPDVEDRVRREHDRRVVRRAQQHPAHLLEHDAELDEREALAAELLGDRERLQPELLAHLLPHRRVVALGGLHEPPDLGLRRLGLEELPHRAPQFFLLLGEGEVHCLSPVICGFGSLGSPRTRSPMMLRWISLEPA